MWLAVFLVWLVLYMGLLYLPAILIFLWLDRYRPGRYIPQRRGLRIAVYLGVLIVISLLLQRQPIVASNWLLSALVFYVMPVPLYYLLRALF